MEVWRQSRAITLVQNVQKLICNHPNVYLVNMNAYIKVGEIPSMCLKILSGNKF